MNISKFNEVKKACYDFTKVTVNGCRQQRNEAEKFLADYVRKNASERKKNSKYAVGIVRENHGTRNYPDLCDEVQIFPIDSLMKNGQGYRANGHILYNSCVIGWLSD